MSPEGAGIFAEANLLSILFPGAHLTRRSLGLFAPVGASLLLAGCGPTGRPRSAGPSLGAPSIEAQNLEAEAAATRARVGLILPLTQNGSPSNVGTAMRNAAELALAEMGGSASGGMVEDRSGGGNFGRSGPMERRPAAPAGRASTLDDDIPF